MYIYIICILNVYHIYYDHMIDVAFSSTIPMHWEERPFREQGMPAGVGSLGRSNKSGGGRLGGIRMEFIRDRRWGSRKDCQELGKKNLGTGSGRRVKEETNLQTAYLVFWQLYPIGKQRVPA